MATGAVLSPDVQQRVRGDARGTAPASRRRISVLVCNKGLGRARQSIERLVCVLPMGRV